MRGQNEYPCYTRFSEHPGKQLDEHVTDFIGGLMGQEQKQPVSGENEVSLPGLTLWDGADQADRVIVPRDGAEELAYNRAREATVQLSTGYSGFFVDGRGTLITASNAVSRDQAEGVSLTTADGKELKARLLARDETNNLAVLKVREEENSGWLPNLPVSDIDAYNYNLAAVGHPHSWSEVYISFGKAEAEPFEKNFPVVGGDAAFDKMGPLMRMDAHTTTGSTGGPVVDSCGNVRGMVVGRTFNGYGAVTSTLAVPGSTITNFLEASGATISPYDMGGGWGRSRSYTQMEDRPGYRAPTYYERGSRRTTTAITTENP